MAVEDFQHLFYPKIWERGTRYSQEGRVFGVKKVTDNGVVYIDADVAGSEDYHVELTLDNDDAYILEAICDCPFAEEGQFCKHMVAALIEAETSKKSLSFSVIDLESVEPEVFKEFCLEKADSDMRFKQELSGYISAGPSTMTFEQACASVEELQWLYHDRHGFLGDGLLSTFVAELEEILTPYLRALKKATLADHFRFIDWLVTFLNGLTIYDDGELLSLVETCFDSLEIRLNDKEEKDLFQLFVKGLKSVPYPGNYSLTYWTFFREHFTKSDFSQAKLDLLDKRLAAASKKKRTSTQEFLFYLDMAVQVMEQEEYPISQLQEFVQPYWSNPDIRFFYVSQCVENEAYSEAVDLLLAEIREQQITDKRTKFHEKLKTIYRVTGQEQVYLALLDEMVLGGDVDRSLYEELKAASPEKDWSERREKLKVAWQTSKNTEALAHFYCEEAYWSELLALAQKHDDILASYYMEVGEHYPAETLKALEIWLRQGMASPKGRAYYQEIANLLTHVKKLKGGQEFVADLLADWRQTYAKRRAMLEEFQNI